MGLSSPNVYMKWTTIEMHIHFILMQTFIIIRAGEELLLVNKAE